MSRDYYAGPVSDYDGVGSEIGFDYQGYRGRTGVRFGSGNFLADAF